MCLCTCPVPPVRRRSSICTADGVYSTCAACVRTVWCGVSGESRLWKVLAFYLSKLKHIRPSSAISDHPITVLARPRHFARQGWRAHFDFGVSSASHNCGDSN